MLRIHHQNYMHPLQTHIILALISLLTFSTIASTLTPTQPHPHQNRGLTVPIPTNRISGLPPGWTGIFTHLRSTRPSLPISSIFIKFFRVAAYIAAKDPIAARPSQRLDYGILVLEFISTEEGAMITREFVQAASLWLLDAAVHGWTGLFEAWVVDRLDGERVYLRLGTIWDLPGGKVSNSPWD